MTQFGYTTGLLSSVLTLALFVGCGGGDGGYTGATGTVSGVVKVDGKAISEEANVTFLSSEGHSATGQTDSSGKFSLSSKGSSEIPVGTYNVAVSPAAPTETSNDPSDFFDESGETPTVEQTQTVIPESAKNPGGSGVTIEVVEGEQNVDVDLSSK